MGLAGTSADRIGEWDEVLRAYACVVDEHRRTLISMRADGMVTDEFTPPPRFAPPSELGPMPTELLPRARALAAETAGLVELATELSTELRAAIAAGSPGPVSPRPFVGVSSGSTMDQRM